MPVLIIGTVEDVQTYNGKNGFGANITISTKIDKRTKRITFRSSDQMKAALLESKLDEEVTLKIELDQSNFGLRFGNVLEVA